MQNLKTQKSFLRGCRVLCSSVGVCVSMVDIIICNALNLGVEFFLLFSHQIRALLSFLFPRLLLLPNFKPVKRQVSVSCINQNLSVMGVASCRSIFLCLMMSVRLVVGFRSAKWPGPAQSSPAQPARPAPACAPLAPKPPPCAPSPLSLSFGSPAQQPLLSLFHLSLPVVP
jgi:hypothetical protein